MDRYTLADDRAVDLFNQLTAPPTMASLNNSVVYSAATNYGNAVAKKGMRIVNRLTGEPDEDHYLHDILTLQPNPLASAFDLVFGVVASVTTSNNGFIHIIREDEKDLTSPVKWLNCIDPSYCDFRYDHGRGYYYDMMYGDGSLNGVSVNNIIHLRGMTLDGLFSPHKSVSMKQNLDINAAIDKNTLELFLDKMIEPFLLMHKGAITPKQEEEMQKRFKHLLKEKFGLLDEEQFTLEKMGTTASSQSAAEFKKLNIEDMARWLNIPLHTIGHLDRMSLSNIEVLNDAWIADQITSLVIRFEQMLNMRLLTKEERKVHRIDVPLSRIGSGNIVSVTKIVCDLVEKNIIDQEEARVELGLPRKKLAAKGGNSGTESVSST